jgi:hypothetical protein
MKDFGLLLKGIVSAAKEQIMIARLQRKERS